MKKVILDLDTGIDDSMALAIVLGSPDFELIGVVSSFGNVYSEDGAQNVLNILHATGNDSIPVFIGAEHSIKSDHFNRLDVSENIHGHNGVGEADIFKSPLIANKNAVQFLIDMTNKYRSELTIIATGPMTNLGLAIKQESKIMNTIGHVVIMGGALTVPGNVNQFTEANISQDPFAAKILFDSSLDITMVGLDVTTRSILNKDHTKQWSKNGTEIGKFYETAVNYYIDIHRDGLAPNANGCYLHDPSAVIAAIHPEWFSTIDLFIEVKQDNYAAGRTTGYSEKVRDSNPNTHVCINVESDKVVNYLQKSIMNLCK